MAEPLVGPQRALQSEGLWRPARRGNDLVPLQRGDLGRPTGPVKVPEPIEPMPLEPAKPFADPRAGGPEHPGNRRDRFAGRRQKHHPPTPVKPSLATRPPSDRLKPRSLPTGKPNRHAESIGKNTLSTVPGLLRRCTRPTVDLSQLHCMVIVQFSHASECLGNNQRSGYTDGAVPVKPALRWTYREGATSSAGSAMPNRTS